VGRTSARAIEAARKKADALKMREAGATLQQIGDKHYRGDRSNAHRAITEALAEQAAENVEEVRKLENARLDAMLLGLWKNATRGDHQATGAVIRIMERRAKLNGLDAPIQTEELGDGVVNVIFDARVKPSGMAPVELEVDGPVAH
jgi:hypothetical protein